MTAISCNPFSDDRKFRLCLQVVFLPIGAKLVLETLPSDVFFWFASFL